MELEELKKKNDMYYNSVDLSFVNKENFFLFLCLDSLEDREIYGKNNMQNVVGRFLEIEMFEYDKQNHKIKIDELKFQQLIYDFKPTALFFQYRTKKELSFYISEKLVVISWMDNLNELIYNGNSFLRDLDKFNIAVIPALTIRENANIEKELQDKYTNHIVEVPFTARCDIFMSDIENISEAKQYDICVMGGSGGKLRLQDYLNGYLKMNRIQDTEIYQRLMNVYGNIVNEFYNIIRTTEQPITDEKIIADIVYKEFSREKLELSIENMNMQYVLSLHIFSHYVYRDVVYEWIVERGYNVVFYGSYYERDERFKNYSRPIVTHGMQLKEEYQKSKICLNTNCAVGIHRSLFESILSGTLLLKPRTIPIYELSDTDLYFTENKDVIYFGSKKELYQKIDWFLKHEEERRKVIQNGQRLVCEKKLDLCCVYQYMMEEIIKKIQLMA